MHSNLKYSTRTILVVTKTMTKTSKTILWLIIAIIVIGGIWYGASRKPAEKLEKEVIKIGAIIFLTGDQSSLGEEVNNALILANELDNAQLERKITLAVEDSQDDANKAISAYNKLRLEKIPVIISSGDQVSYVLSPIANTDKVVILNTVAASQEISGEYTFRAFITTKQQAKIMGEYATKDMKIKKIGLIYINNIYGESYRNTLLDTVKQNNGEIVSEEAYGIADKDVKTQILKIMEKKPEAILVAGFGPAYSLVFKQLREYGWRGVILTDNTLSIPFFFNGIGIENLNDTYFTSTNFDAVNPTNDKMRDFVEKYKAKFRMDPSFIGAFAFDSYNILASTIKKCGYDPEAIRNCLLNVKGEQSILGSVDFSTHEMKIPLYIKKIEGNKVVIKKVIE